VSHWLSSTGNQPDAPRLRPTCAAFPSIAKIDQVKNWEINQHVMSRMSRSSFILALAALASFVRVGSIAAQELGTPDQAKAMLDRAIVALKSDAPGALNKFNDSSDQQFHDRDLYICFDVSDGKITADSSNGLRGIDIRTLKLKDDPMGQRAYDIAQITPQESVRTMDYSFPKPGTTEPTAKSIS
jgi:hypothetical protein